MTVAFEELEAGANSQPAALVPGTLVAITSKADQRRFVFDVGQEGSDWIVQFSPDSSNTTKKKKASLTPVVDGGKVVLDEEDGSTSATIFKVCEVPKDGSPYWLLENCNTEEKYHHNGGLYYAQDRVHL